MIDNEYSTLATITVLVERLAQQASDSVVRLLTLIACTASDDALLDGAHELDASRRAATL
jgi:hypothetical protein